LSAIQRKAYIKLQQLSAYKHVRDVYNRTIYGPKAPQYAERLWVNPKEIVAVDYERVMVHGWGFYSSAMVLNHWPFPKKYYKSLWELPKVDQCKRRYIDNESWEETGAYAFYSSMMNKRNGTRKYSDAQIIKRHKRFDMLYESVKQGQRVKTVEEICPRPYRERGGILLHIGPDGELLFSETGSHRLAVGLILNLERIPAQLGVVHKNAIPKLDQYRGTEEP